MQITVFKTTKDRTAETAHLIDLQEVIERMKEDSPENYVKRFRVESVLLSDPKKWLYYDRLERICPVAQFMRNKDKQRVFRKYNGVSVLKIIGLNNALEVEKAKQHSSLMT